MVTSRWKVKDMAEFAEALMDCYENNFGKYPKSCEGCQYKKKCESITVEKRDEDGRPIAWTYSHFSKES